MSSVNKHIILGNLGADPEVKYTQSGDCITSFSVATSERWKNKDGEKQERTEWHKIVAFGKLGELCGEYLAKGSKVYLEGSSHTNKWTDKDGIDRSTKQVKIREITFLGSKNGETSSASPPVEDGDPGPQDADIPF